MTACGEEGGNIRYFQYRRSAYFVKPIHCEVQGRSFYGCLGGSRYEIVEEIGRLN